MSLQPLVKTLVATSPNSQTLSSLVDFGGVLHCVDSNGVLYKLQAGVLVPLTSSDGVLRHLTVAGTTLYGSSTTQIYYWNGVSSWVAVTAPFAYLIISSIYFNSLYYFFDNFTGNIYSLASPVSSPVLVCSGINGCQLFIFNSNLYALVTDGTVYKINPGAPGSKTLKINAMAPVNTFTGSTFYGGILTYGGLLYAGTTTNSVTPTGQLYSWDGISVSWTIVVPNTVPHVYYTLFSLLGNLYVNDSTNIYQLISGTYVLAGSVPFNQAAAVLFSGSEYVGLTNKLYTLDAVISPSKSSILPASTGKLSHLRILTGSRVESQARQIHEIMKDKIS
jgi:hypothetical protein